MYPLKINYIGNFKPYILLKIYIKKMRFFHGHICFSSSLVVLVYGTANQKRKKIAH